MKGGDESLKMWTGNNEVLKDTVPQMLTAVEQKVDECSSR